MSKSLIISMIIFLSLIRCSNAEEVVVVANMTDASAKVSRMQIRNLFLGGATPHDLVAIALPADNKTRLLFNTRLIGLTESRIQSYWAQMRFTGRKKEPKEVSNETLLVEYLINHEGTLGYLPSDYQIPKELTVILTIN